MVDRMYRCFPRYVVSEVIAEDAWVSSRAISAVERCPGCSLIGGLICVRFFSKISIALSLRTSWIIPKALGYSLGMWSNVKGLVLFSKKIFLNEREPSLTFQVSHS